MDERMKILKEKYKDLIKEKTIQEIDEMCKNKELNIDAHPTEIWVMTYSGEQPEEQTEFLLNQLYNAEVTGLIEKDHLKLFKKIYAVKDYKNQQDIIAILNSSIIDIDKFNELYSETIEFFSLKNYVTEQLKLAGTFVQEEYDPLHYKEQQAKVDEIEEKYKNGEITLGEMFKEFGWIDDNEYDKEKVGTIIEELINEKINSKDILDKINNQEITIVELQTIQEILKRKYPETYEKLSQEV